MSIIDPTPTPSQKALGVLGIAAALCAGSFGLGWAIKARLCETQVASLQAQWAQERAAAARASADAAAARLQAQAQADQAAADTVQTRNAQSRASTAEVKHALQTIPMDTGRGLSGAVRGLLNGAITSAAGPSLALPAPQPTATGAAAAAATPAGYAGAPVSYAIADASPAAMAPAAERDVATWIADALESYETCRARIDALRAWDQTAFGATKQGAIDGR